LTIYQGFLTGLQTDHRNAKRGRNELSPGKRAGGGIRGIEEEDYDSTDFIPFLRGKKDGGCDGRQQFRAGMHILSVLRKAASSGGIPFTKIEQR